MSVQIHTYIHEFTVSIHKQYTNREVAKLLAHHVRTEVDHKRQSYYTNTRIDPVARVIARKALRKEVAS